jgi:two-component system, OmpR family, KDP operon response regulator KdpE
MSGARILVVDDEPEIRNALETTLRGAGYDVDGAASGEDALVRASLRPPEAVILDLVLPGKSGVEVARELREWSDAPILIMSVVGEEVDKVAALDAGADDYVTKPFGMDELLARLRATLRRASHDSKPVIEIGDLEIDLDKRSVRRSGELLQLTPHEFGLLKLFATNEGKLLTHRTILREVWGPAYQSESHYLHVYVSQLRRKLEADPTRPRYLLTETGTGYRLVDPKS